MSNISALNKTLYVKGKHEEKKERFFRLFHELDELKVKLTFQFHFK